MKYRNKLAITIALGSTLISSLTFAQVEEIVVTATRTPTSIDRIGSSISVIDDIQLEQQQIRFVTDALHNLPGVSVSQNGPRGTASAVRLRGRGSEDTMVIIDGIEISDPSRTQTAFDFSQFTSAGIGRIEVLRGSQSTLYGSDAVGGVVNVINPDGTGDLQGSAFVEAGSFDTYTVGGNVRGGLQEDRLGYNVSLERTQTNGFSAADENLAGNTETEEYENISTNAKLTYAATDDLDLRAVVRYATGSLNFDSFGGAFGDAAGQGNDFDQLATRISAEYRYNDLFTGEVGYGYTRNESTPFATNNFPSASTGERHKVNFQGTLDFNPDNIVIFGIDHEEESFVSNVDPAGQEVSITSYFGQYQVSPTDAMHLSFGIRVDDHETFGAFETYRVTAAYNFDATGTKLKGSYSTGFRAPSLFELFGLGTGFDPSFGNTGLQPEESDSWDIGVEQSFLDDALNIEVAYFQIDTDNEIEFCCFGNGLASNYNNVPGTTTSNGVEVAADWLVTEQLTFGIAYTLNDTETEAGERLIRRPKHLFSGNANLSLFNGRGNVNLNATHSTDTVDSDFDPVTFAPVQVALDDYWVVNLAASYEITESLTANLRLENMFDEEYQTIIGYGTADRAIYGGLNFKF